MDRTQAAAVLPILQAFAEGKEIQYKTNDNVWEDMKDNLYSLQLWGHPEKYRIKPEPRVFYAVEYSDGSISVSRNEKERDQYRGALAKLTLIEKL